MISLINDEPFFEKIQLDNNADDVCIPTFGGLPIPNDWLIW